ncbi:hypothetical protein INT45_002882 [Circinella minor]|uniref:Endonuclease/exonuclease/phosphatase domain-containing protein n=1 Tax=Circinella minor TaxID=1195481 RepID=A0A8H7VLJ9_9FUNG|nr:hypothetical protein INT45_002882 [Circinella minor]
MKWITFNINTKHNDNTTSLPDTSGDGDYQGLSQTIDAEGDLIMESLEALIEEHTIAEISASPTKDTTVTVANIAGVQADMNYLSSLSLRSSTHTKIDNLSVMACRQLIKKIETLSQSDTVAGQRPSAKGIEFLAHESNFIKHLKQQKPHLIALQESHAATEQIQSSLNFQFQTISFIWTKHCGLVWCISLVIANNFHWFLEASTSH